MLTSFIKDNPDVRERFAKEFIKPPFSVTKPLLAPPLSKRYSLIGTAFDYLLRFRLSRLNPQTIQPHRWIAEEAVDHLEDAPAMFSKAKAIIASAKANMATFLQSGDVSEELIESALKLATIDPIARFGIGMENLGVIHDVDIQELRSLSSLVNERDFTAQNLCLLNPTFGSASTLVDGADADLIIDESIIDIKTIKDLKLERSAFDQIMGYYVLHLLGEVGTLSPKPHISKVAIYFSRYGYLHQMSLSEIVNPATFPAFLRWFEGRAKEEWPPFAD